MHEDERFGAPRALMDVLISLKENGVHPIVLTHSKKNVYHFCKKNNIKVISSGHINIVVGEKYNLISYLKFFPKLILNILFDELAYLKIKKYINLSNIDFIHSNVSILSLGVKLKKKCKNAKYVVHLREPASIVKTYLFTKGNLINYLNRNADYFVGISKNNAEQWIKMGIFRKKLFVVYDGVLLPNRNKINKSGNSILQAVVVGSFSKQKNQEEIVKAIQLLPLPMKKKIHVTFIGGINNDYEKQIKRQIKKYNINSNFSFLGYQYNLNKLYNNFDIGIMPSIAEPFGRVTVEYMAHGLLTLASNSGANSEIVDNNENGLLFELNSPGTLSSVLVNIISNFSAYTILRKRGQEKAYSKFSAQSSAFKLKKFYEKNRYKRYNIPYKVKK